MFVIPINELIDVWMWHQSYISELNSIWSWYIIFYVFLILVFIFFRVFSSLSISEFGTFFHNNSWAVLIVVQVQLSPFSPHHDLPPSNLPSLALSVCPLYMFLDGPSPIFPNYPIPPPLWLLSVCSLFQCLVVFCLLVCFADKVPLIGQIIPYLSFTTWLISLT